MAQRRDSGAQELQGGRLRACSGRKEELGGDKERTANGTGALLARLAVESPSRAGRLAMSVSCGAPPISGPLQRPRTGARV